MFWKKDRALDAIKKAVQDLGSIRTNPEGATRRATGMVPIAAAGSTREVAQTSSLRFHQLLISLEGNQRTGCLRIIAPRRKARSAILIYKGRVVGCLYGSKRLDYQCLQQDAHKRALADLASPGNILDAYELPEELVLAAASLFNGELIDTNVGDNAATCFEQSFRTLANTERPGCLVVSTIDDEMVCMVYVYDGRIIGVFSARDGWSSPSFESASKYVAADKLLKISASFLPVSDQKQAINLGFSLTGLADSSQRRLAQQQVQAIDSLASIRSESATYSQLETVYSKQLPATTTQTPPVQLSNAHRLGPRPPVRSSNVFAIAP